LRSMVFATVIIAPVADDRVRRAYLGM